MRCANLQCKSETMYFRGGSLHCRPKLREPDGSQWGTMAIDLPLSRLNQPLRRRNLALAQPNNCSSSGVDSQLSSVLLKGG